MQRRDAAWLRAIYLCEMATMLVFLNYTAVLPILQAEWGMRHGEAGVIFSAYQACYLLAVLVQATLTEILIGRPVRDVSQMRRMHRTGRLDLSADQADQPISRGGCFRMNLHKSLD